MNHVPTFRRVIQRRNIVLCEVRRGNVLDFNASAVPLNKQITANSKTHNWGKSIELLDEALQHGHAVNVVSFGAALAACDRGSFWQHALRLFRCLASPMVSPFATPNNITWNATISACSRAKQWERACGLLAQMTEAQSKPDTITINSTMRSLGGTGSGSSRWQLAVKLCSQLWQNRLLPNLTTWSTVTNLCAQGNAWHVSLFFLQQALAPLAQNGQVRQDQSSDWSSSDPSNSLDAASITSVLIACARSRRWQRSMQLFSEVFSTGRGGYGVKPDLACFNAAMSACERGGHWSGALHLMHQMQNTYFLQPDLTSVNTLLSASEKGAKWQMSLNIFSLHLPSVVSGLAAKPSSEDLTVTYTALLSAFTRGAVWPVALSVLDDMQKKQLQPGPLHFGSVLDAMPSKPGSRPKATGRYLENEMKVEDQPRADVTSRIINLLNLSVFDALHRRQSMDQNVPREHCQEITKYIVAGVETLLRKVRSEEVAETLNLFREVVYQPVLLCLLLLSKAETQEDRTLALNNVRLEEQFGLGSFFTAEALRDLGFSGSDLTWQKNAELAALHALRERLWLRSLENNSKNMLVPWTKTTRMSANSLQRPEKALAQQLAVWLAYDLVVPKMGRGDSHDGRGQDRHFTMEGRPGFASNQKHLPTDEVPLLSIFVEHDRGNHAERWALLSVIADLLAEGLQPCDFHLVQGTVQLYAVHTPCISCLAAFCQFQSAFPQVSLEVAFKDWFASRETMHQLQ